MLGLGVGAKEDAKNFFEHPINTLMDSFKGQGELAIKYVIQPDAKGQWGIDVELSRPARNVGKRVKPPTCSDFHADSLVRVPIRKPDEDYPSQTLGPYWPDRTVPKSVRIQDSEVKDDPKYYTVILIANEKAVGDTI